MTRQFPYARRVVVRNSLHVTAIGDTDDCAQRIVRHWIATQGVVIPNGCGPAPATCRRCGPSGAFPTALPADAAPRRVARAAALTVADLPDRWWNNYSGHGVGLRGGTWRTPVPTGSASPWSGCDWSGDSASPGAPCGTATPARWSSTSPSTGSRPAGCVARGRPRLAALACSPVTSTGGGPGHDPRALLPRRGSQQLGDAGRRRARRRVEPAGSARPHPPRRRRPARARPATAAARCRPRAAAASGLLTEQLGGTVAADAAIAAACSDCGLAHRRRCHEGLRTHQRLAEPGPARRPASPDGQRRPAGVGGDRPWRSAGSRSARPPAAADRVRRSRAARGSPASSSARATFGMTVTRVDGRRPPPPPGPRPRVRSPPPGRGRRRRPR